MDLTSVPTVVSPPALEDPTWIERATALVGKLEEAHAAAFRAILAAEKRARPDDFPQLQTARVRDAEAALRAVFLDRLQQRLGRARDALAACGVRSDRFDAMIEGAWTIETFPRLWVDLHAMLAALRSVEA